MRGNRTANDGGWRYFQPQDALAKQRHLRTAPIREALLDIRVPPLPESRLPALENLYSSVSAEFPAKQVLHEHQFELGIKIGAEPEASVSSGRLARGVVFKTAEGNRLVQFRLDGFTFNWLKPYGTWDELKSAALPLWRVFADSGGPDRVIRLALRYINVLSIPVGGAFEEFLTAGPRVPDALPQTLSRFVTRLTVVDAETHCQAHITQAFSG